METKKVTFGKPLAVRGYTIIPVIEQYVRSTSGKGGIYFFGAREPVAIVLVSPSGYKVFRLKEEKINPVTIEELTAEIPELKSSLPVTIREYPGIFQDKD